MAVAEYTKRAIKKYQAENYEFIKIRLNKGEKEIIKNLAAAEGKSVNEFIRSRALGGDVQNNVR